MLIYVNITDSHTDELTDKHQKYSSEPHKITLLSNKSKI